MSSARCTEGAKRRQARHDRVNHMQQPASPFYPEQNSFRGILSPGGGRGGREVNSIAAGTKNAYEVLDACK